MLFLLFYWLTEWYLKGKLFYKKLLFIISVIFSLHLIRINHLKQTRTIASKPIV